MYNIQKTAGSSLGYRHTPETIEKLKERKRMSKGTSLLNVKADLRNMANNEIISRDTQVDTAVFLGLKPKTFTKRKATAANKGIPLIVKAKAEGIKGNWYHVTFPTKL